MDEYENCNSEDEKLANYIMEDFQKDLEKFRKIYNEEIAKEGLEKYDGGQTSPYLEMIRILSIRSDVIINTIEKLNKNLTDHIAFQIKLVEENVLNSVYAQIKTMEESIKNFIDAKFSSLLDTRKN